VLKETPFCFAKTSLEFSVDYDKNADVLYISSKRPQNATEFLAFLGDKVIEWGQDRKV